MVVARLVIIKSLSRQSRPPESGKRVHPFGNQAAAGNLRRMRPYGFAPRHCYRFALSRM
jgi:hypothetical protein